MRTMLSACALLVGVFTFTAVAQEQGTVPFGTTHVTDKTVIELVSGSPDSFQLFKITYGLPEGVEPGRYEVSMLRCSTKPDTLRHPDDPLKFVIGPTMLGWEVRDTVVVREQRFLERYWWVDRSKVGVPPWEEFFLGSRFKHIGEVK